MNGRSMVVRYDLKFQSNLKTKHYSHHLRTEFNLHNHNQFLFSSYSFKWLTNSIRQPKQLGLFQKAAPGAFLENPFLPV